MREANLFTSDIHFGGHPSKVEEEKVRQAFESIGPFLAQYNIQIDQLIFGGDTVEHLMGGLVPDTNGDKQAYARDIIREQIKWALDGISPRRLFVVPGNHEIFHVDGAINAKKAWMEQDAAFQRTTQFFKAITPEDIELTVKQGFTSPSDGIVFHHGHHLDVADTLRTKLETLKETELSTDEKMEALNTDEELPIVLQELWAKYITVLGAIIKHAGLDTYILLENLLAVLATISSLYIEHKNKLEARSIQEHQSNPLTKATQLQLELLDTFKAHTVISGHTHIPSILQMEGQTVVSLGSWTFGASNPICGLQIKDRNEFWMIEYNPESKAWFIRDQVQLG